MERYYQPTKIYHGIGSISILPEIVKKYGNKVFLVTTADEPLQPLYKRVKSMLSENQIETIHFDEVNPNPSTEMIEKGVELLKDNLCDVIVALGGGSCIDTAKVLSLTFGKKEIDWQYLFEHFDSPFVDYPTYNDNSLPIIAIPTTSGTGSQVTQAAVISNGEEKLSIYHQQCFPTYCLLDPELVATLPLRMSMATGFDAFTHAFESYINVHHSTYSRMDSINALKLIYEHLPKLHDDISSLEERKYMSLADTLAGKALFPAYISVMKDKNKECFEQLCKVLVPNIESDDYGEELEKIVVKFLQSIGLYNTLKELGVSQEDFEKICSHPALHHLPFASYQQCIEVLNKAYDR